MAETENSKDLISVLWSGADILRSKMDANEYKDYLLGIVFYKYLSDSFLIRVYDLIYDEKPDSLRNALEAYKEALEDESAEELKEQIKSECHYVIEPDLTYTCFADAARNNSFNREQLQKAFNNIEQSDPLFADLFTDIDLYSNRLGTGDQKQSDTISNLIKEIDKADLLHSDAEILGNAYEYLIGQFASETGKKAGEFYTPQAVSKILTKIAIAGQEMKRGLSVYDPCIRFKGFTDDWEQRKLGDVLADMYNVQTPSRNKAEFWNGEISWLSSGELNRGTVNSSLEKITEAGKKSANLRIVPKGTFIMAITGLEAAGTRGNCALLGLNTTLNQSCMALFPKKGILDSRFLFQWYRKVGEEYGTNYTQGTKQQSYNAELIKILPITLPNVDEQIKISLYLENLDHLITLHQNKCEELKKIKKYMLQNMFV